MALLAARLSLSQAREIKMFTADDARRGNDDELDERIAHAVRNNKHGNGAYLRVYADDSFRDSIAEDLEKRGFKNV